MGNIITTYESARHFSSLGDLDVTFVSCKTTPSSDSMCFPLLFDKQFINLINKSRLISRSEFVERQQGAAKGVPHWVESIASSCLATIRSLSLSLAGLSNTLSLKPLPLSFSHSLFLSLLFMISCSSHSLISLYYLSCLCHHALIFWRFFVRNFNIYLFVVSYYGFIELVIVWRLFVYTIKAFKF